MIKIVYVITNCKNTGPMNQTLNIIKNMDRSVFQPIVITLFPEEAGNSVIDRYLTVVSEHYCLEMNKVTAVLAGRGKLKALLEKIHPDLIQGLGMPPYTLSLGYKDAVHLVTLRNYCYQDYPDYYGKRCGILLAHKDMALIRRQMKKGEPFVTCSESLSRMYAEKHHMKFDFIKNGVDTERYKYADAACKEEQKKKLGFSKDNIIIACAGLFIDRKDQQFAIEGILRCSHADQICMVLMGAGPNLEHLQKEYGKDKRFLFTGEIKNVCDYLQASDAYLSASKSEGMPNGVLEAMSTGLPVFLSDIPQHMEVLGEDGKYGSSYRLGDKEHFASQLDRFLDMDLSAMGATAGEAARKEFSSVVMSRRYQELYLKLMEDRRKK